MALELCSMVWLDLVGVPRLAREYFGLYLPI